MKNKKNIVILSVSLVLILGIIFLILNATLFSSEKVSDDIDISKLEFIDESIKQDKNSVHFSVNINNKSKNTYLFKTIDLSFKDKSGNEIISTQVDLNQKVKVNQMAKVSAEIGLADGTDKITSVDYQFNKHND